MITSRPDARVREVTCDSCAAGCEEIPFDETGSFAEFVAEIKRRGWKLRKTGNEWEHLCPDCQ